MQKVLVAGCGHGGLVAAAKLSEAGFDVTVIEKCNKDAIGHDWEDRFTFSLLEDITGTPISKFPENSWRYRGDCAFVSPAKRMKVEIHYDENSRQKVMWRKPLINMLVDNALNKGVKFIWNTEIKSPLISDNKVAGLVTENEKIVADIVIDACGCFSPVRSNLPECYKIERTPERGDLFYGWRAYFNKTVDTTPDCPHEVYMYHEGEQGLSWCCTNENTVDILIGRIDKFDDEKVEEQVNIFRQNHPWIGNEIVHGGNYGVIPVRRPLSLMVGDRYAAIGDSAFMTLPMNGMGIDLALNAGLLLADTIISNKGKDFTAEILWNYNERFHKQFGFDSSKNEGLKNAILSIPSEGVDFLFENEVIQSSDLAGAGKKTDFKSLLGKFKRGMKNPPYFFAIINGLIKGSKTSKLYANPPENYNLAEIKKWSDKIYSYHLQIL